MAGVGGLRDRCGLAFRRFGHVPAHECIGVLHGEIPLDHQLVEETGQRIRARLAAAAVAIPAGQIDRRGFEPAAECEALLPAAIGVDAHFGCAVFAEAGVEVVMRPRHGDRTLELQQIDVDQVLHELRAHADAAIAVGVFGVPAFEVDGKVFWGLDALPMLRTYLQGNAWFDGPQWTDAHTVASGATRRHP